MMRSLLQTDVLVSGPAQIKDYFLLQNLDTQGSPSLAPWVVSTLFVLTLLPYIIHGKNISYKGEGGDILQVSSRNAERENLLCFDEMPSEEFGDKETDPRACSRRRHQNKGRMK